MAHLHFDIRARTMQGQSKNAKLAVDYLTRSGPYAPAPQEIAYLQRESSGTRHRNDLVWEDTRNMPTFAYDNATLFFESAEAYERANGRWGIAVQAMLPRELPREQQREIIDDFLTSQLKQQPLLVVMHEPVGRDGQPQPHFHVLFSERTNDGIERTASGYFRRGYADDREPGAAKDRFFHERQAPARIRMAYSDIVNAALERHGIDERVDPRSLWTRGIDRDVAPKASREDLDRTRTQERAIATEYWEARKITLGLLPGEIHDREIVREKTRQWSRDRHNIIDRSRDRYQELHQAWTDRAIAEWKDHDRTRTRDRDRDRDKTRDRERMPSPTIPVPDRTHPKGRFEVDLDREEFGR